MEQLNLRLEQLSQALPEEFEFYHLGKVLAQTAELHDFPNLEDTLAMGYAFNGDTNGILIAIFDRGLDSSTYSEMGNILASQFATRLSKNNELDVMIGPPKELSENTLGHLSRSASSTLARTYHHLYNGKIIPVQVLVLPLGEQGGGRA